jgi:ribosomal 50S subunit-recycling heat shock protein
MKQKKWRGDSDMRLDKFLKVSRLIKRRTLAKEVADQGRITVNGNQAKASSDVKAGDELKVRFGQKLVTVKVNELKETTKKEEAAGMYTIVKEEKLGE